MRKQLLFSLLFLLTSVIVPNNSYASSNISTYHIPVDGSLDSVLAKSPSYQFIIPFPKGATDVDTSSVSFNGHGTLSAVVSKDSANHQFKVLINGEVQTKQSQDVYGYKNASGLKFQTEPGDNEWLFSNGLRWQLNSLNRYCVASGGDIDTSCQTSENYNPGSGTPPIPIPDRTLTTVARPNMSASGVTWLTADNKVLDAGIQVDTSTVKLSDENHLGPQGPDIDGNAYAINVHQYFGTTIVGDQSTLGDNYEFPDTTYAPSGWQAVGYATQSRNYGVTFYYALHAKTLPSTIYYYNGDVSFSYTSSPDPYVGITADATQTPECFDGTSDTSVDIPAYSTLFNVTDQSSVDYWKFYAKVDGDDSTLQQNLNASPNSTNGSNDFTFTIHASSVTSDPYTVKYKVTAIAVMKATDQYLNPYTYQDTTYTSVTVQSSLCQQKNQPTPPQFFPPWVALTAPPKVRAGDNVGLSAEWGDPNVGGQVTHAYWNPGGNGTIPDLAQDGSTWYPREGTYWPTISVVDNYFLSGFDYKSITVTPPTISIVGNYSGTLKENRKITLSYKADSPAHYPIDDTKTVWVITPYSGAGAGQASSIRYVGSLTGVSSVECLFKTAGKYTAQVTVTNTYGLTATAGIFLDIAPDLPPVTHFHITNKAVIRDPNNSNHATIDLWDDSYSPDGDIIQLRIWKYAYDSNNDGNFNDETWNIIDSTNLTHVQIQPNQVGRYEFEELTVEAFGQPTISQFITNADYRSSNTWQ